MDISTFLNALPYISIGFFVSIFGVVLNGCRYSIMLKKLGSSISIIDSTLVIFAGQTASYFAPLRLGSVGMRPVASKVLAGVKMKNSLFVTVFENVFEMGWQIPVLPFLVIMVGEYAMYHNLFFEVFLAASFLVLFLILIKKQEYFFPKIWKLKRMIPKRMRKKLQKKISRENTEKMVNESQYFISDRILIAKVLVITSVIALIAPIALWAMGLMLSLPMGYREAFLIYWIAVIIGRLSGIPGGYITKDISIVGVMGILGFGFNASVMVALLYRVVTMASVAIFGVPVIGYVSGKSVLGRKKGG